MDYYQYYEGDFSGDHHHYYEPVTSTTTTYRVMSPRYAAATATVAAAADDRICAVCASPNASTMHFGGRSCKACAAFFRRSVSMRMNYRCIGSDAPCRIHYELRMLCRHCRYVKCIEAGMRIDLVRAKREEVILKKRSKDLIYREDEEKADGMKAFYEPAISTYLADTSPPLSTSSPKSDQEHETDRVVADVDDKRTMGEFNSMIKDEMPISPSKGYINLSSIPSVSSYEPEACCSTSYPMSFDDWYISRGQSVDVEDNQLFGLLDHLIKMETALNDRRKVMYTETPIRDFFDVLCECPFERKDLKIFDFRTFRGMVKHDFQMILDFVKQTPDFDLLNRVEKNIFYRMTCAVDTMINCAYYTYRLGMDEKILVLFNGNYIPMEPEPMSGEEPGAESHFSSKDDFTKYKTLMPVKLRQWHTMAVPFAQLNISFEEFVLLKMLTIWHVANYKLSEDGRQVCSRQRDLIIATMHRICIERGEYDPTVRVGQLLLSMSYIMEQVQTLTTSYVMITFFDVLNCDSLMHDVLSFKY